MTTMDDLHRAAQMRHPNPAMLLNNGEKLLTEHPPTNPDSLQTTEQFAGFFLLIAGYALQRVEGDLEGEQRLVALAASRDRAMMAALRELHERVDIRSVGLSEPALTHLSEYLDG